ncbi:MAG: TonB-dependent receptor [Thermodesulfobacteriota bacterium]
MKNFIGSTVLPLATFIMLITPISALAIDRLDRLDLELNVGSRVDQLDWSIAGNIDGDNPNILSELTWEDLEITEIISKGRIIMINNRVPFGGTLRGSFSYGEIESGANQDSDFGLDNRTNEWSRSNNRADEGEVWDLTLGGGLVFKTPNRKLIISPLIGGSYHAQNLTIHDGEQTLSLDNPFSADPADDPPPVGPIAGLASTYEAEWRSGWVGVDLEFQPIPAFELHGSVELHAAEFEAVADWNLRSDFKHPKSFTHESTEAAGVVAGFGTKFGARNLLVNLDLHYQKWRAEDGIDKTYFSDGSIGATRVNEVNWESFSVAAGLTVRF